MKSLFNRLFALDGRARRREWWSLTLLALVVQGVALSGLIVPSVDLQPTFVAVTGWRWVCPLLLTLGISLDIAVCVRRLHDLNRSGWLLLPLRLLRLTPLFFVEWVWFGCFAGTAGANRFGEGRVS